MDKKNLNPRSGVKNVQAHPSVGAPCSEITYVQIQDTEDLTSHSGSKVYHQKQQCSKQFLCANNQETEHCSLKHLSLPKLLQQYFKMWTLGYQKKNFQILISLSLLVPPRPSSFCFNLKICNDFISGISIGKLFLFSKTFSIFCSYESKEIILIL